MYAVFESHVKYQQKLSGMGSILVSPAVVVGVGRTVALVAGIEPTASDDSELSTIT